MLYLTELGKYYFAAAMDVDETQYVQLDEQIHTLNSENAAE